MENKRATKNKPTTRADQRVVDIYRAACDAVGVPATKIKNGTTRMPEDVAMRRVRLWLCRAEISGIRFGAKRIAAVAGIGPSTITEMEKDVIPYPGPRRQSVQHIVKRFKQSLDGKKPTGGVSMEDVVECYLAIRHTPPKTGGRPPNVS